MLVMAYATAHSDPNVSPEAAPPAASVAVCSVDKYGAKGDGVSDDGPAILAAVDAATATKKPATVLFARGKTYYMAPNAAHPCMNLENVSDITIDGNGAGLLLDAPDIAVNLKNCTRCAVRNFVVDYKRLPYTQGVITAVDAAQTSFDVKIMDGYELPSPLPPINAWGQSMWLSILGPSGIGLRRGMPDALSVDALDLVSAADRIYRVKLKNARPAFVAMISPGDRTYLDAPAGITGIKAAVFCAWYCSDIKFSNLTVYSSPGFAFYIFGDEGPITVDGAQIRIKPGTNRVMSTRSDGIHCKANRIGPVIENCYFEGLMDDSINIGIGTKPLAEIVSPSEFRMMIPNAIVNVGDRIQVFDTVSGAILGEAVITTRRYLPPMVDITLDTPIDGMPAAVNSPAGRLAMFNLGRCGCRFLIKNCTFNPQRHSAAVIHAHDGIIENNTINGGLGFDVSNSIVWNEGPVPANVVFRNNRFTDTGGLRILSDCSNPSAQAAVNIVLDGNRFVNSRWSPVLIRNAKDVVIRNTTVIDNDGVQRAFPPFTIGNCMNLDFQAPLQITDPSDRLPALVELSHMSADEMATLHLDWRLAQVSAPHLTPAAYTSIR